MKNFKDRKELTVEEAQKAYANGYAILVYDEESHFKDICIGLPPVHWKANTYKFYYATKEEAETYTFVEYKIHEETSKHGKRIPKKIQEQVMEDYTSRNTSAKAIASKYNISKKAVYRILQRYNIQYSRCSFKRIPKALHKNIIEEFILNGVSSKQLAQDYDISVSSVYRILHKYGYNKTWGKI